MLPPETNEEDMTAPKNYEVHLTNGNTDKITAQQVTYDDVGNLMFLNFKTTLQTPQNPAGQEVELVKCYNARHYISYCHAPHCVQH